MLRVLLAATLVGIVASQIGDVYVDISAGTVKGQSFLLPDIIPGNKTINRFHGIPYATPPVGDLRFRVYFSFLVVFCSLIGTEIILNIFNKLVPQLERYLRLRKRVTCNKI